MELELGKWLLDVAKYMLTALILANFFWRHGFTWNNSYSDCFDGRSFWRWTLVGS